MTADGLTVDGDVTVTGASAISLSSEQHITYQTTSTNATAGDHIFKSYNTEIMRIDGNNNRVGIGTDSPAYRLDVQDSSDPAQIRLKEDGNTNGFIFKNFNGAEAQLVNADNGPMVFKTNDTERMRILAGGNVGIGTSSPVSPLTTSIGAGSAGSLNNQIAMTHTGASNSYHIKTIRASANDEPAGLAFVENTTERMRIDSSGNVGIGTGSPNTLTHIYGGASGRTWTPDNADKLALENSQSVAFDIRTPADEQGLIMFSDADARARGILAYAHSSDFMYFNTAGAEAMRIDSSGNLLVGTSDNEPYNNNAGNTDDNGITVSGSGWLASSRFEGVAAYFNRTNTIGDIVSFNFSGATKGTISVSTTATAYNTSSDQRLKENIVDAPSASDDIDAIQVRSFDWKADGSHQKYGMVAQELVTVAPEAVTQPEDPEEMMSVDYSKLVPMMLKEIQSLRARVAQLEGAN